MEDRLSLRGGSCLSGLQITTRNFARSINQPATCCGKPPYLSPATRRLPLMRSMGANMWQLPRVEARTRNPLRVEFTWRLHYLSIIVSKEDGACRKWFVI